MRRAVLDTNVFVAAGFRRHSASARLCAEIAQGGLVLVWSQPTRDETKAVLDRIPKLDWSSVAAFFGDEGRFDADPDEAAAGFVEHPADRKFAALALASGAPLVSSDRHLLAHPGRLDIWTPDAFLRARRAIDRGRSGLR